MAFTPTEEGYLKAIAAAFVEAQFTTQAQVTAMLRRLKLEQDLRKLQSGETNLRNTFAVDTGEFNDALVALQAQQAVAQAAIDALP